MSFKNHLIKLFASLYRLFFKGNPRNQESPHFLIVSTTGLGDTLWATPAIKALKSSFPQCTLSVLTSPIGEEILKHNPYIDQLYVLKRSTLTSFLLLFFTLRRKKVEIALIFHASQRPVLPFCLLIGASQIIGTEKINKGLDFLLTKRLPLLQIHEIERRLNIASAVGATARDTPLLELHLSGEDEKRAAAFLKMKNVPSYLPLIGIHPGAKDAFKQWPAELFAELGSRLNAHFGSQIIITGTKEEKTLVESIASSIPGSIALIGELSLRPLAALIKNMSLFISNDTGPMHVAFAMQIPTIGLFAPTDFKLCGPYLSPRAFVIQKSRTCTPCLRKKCKDPLCLLQISVDEVFENALNLYYLKADSLSFALEATHHDL
jgi:lipopolysaccharide heptosyltransferase II